MKQRKPSKLVDALRQYVGIAQRFHWQASAVRDVRGKPQPQSPLELSIDPAFWSMVNPDRAQLEPLLDDLKEIYLAWFKRYDAVYKLADPPLRADLYLGASEFLSHGENDNFGNLIQRIRLPENLERFQRALWSIEHRLAEMIVSKSGDKSPNEPLTGHAIAFMDGKAKSIFNYLKKSNCAKSITEICDSGKGDYRTVKKRLDLLVEIGEVIQLADGKYHAKQTPKK